AAWLPHTRPGWSQDCLRTVGLDAAGIATRIVELLALLDHRREVRRADPARWRPAVLVVLDGAQRLRAMPGVARLLAEGPAAGIYPLCVEDDHRRLPEECTSVAVLTTALTLTLRRDGEAPLTGVLPDRVDEAWLDWVARALAPVRDVGPE